MVKKTFVSMNKWFELSRSNEISDMGSMNKIISHDFASVWDMSFEISVKTTSRFSRVRENV